MGKPWENMRWENEKPEKKNVKNMMRKYDDTKVGIWWYMRYMRYIC
jgi:hypothetical protein